MSHTCALCKTEIGNTSLIFKKSDIEINSLIPPNRLAENDLVCVTCFNEMLEDPKSNTKKARITTLVDIVKNEMDKNQTDMDVIFEVLDAEMGKWSLSEATKAAYLVEITDIVEDVMHHKLNNSKQGV